MRPLILEKVPLLVLAAGSCVATVLAQSAKQATASLTTFPFVVRVANALVSTVVYLGKTLWPADLAIFYPHPATIGETIPLWMVLGSAGILAAITALAVAQVRRRPFIAVGWLWYLGMLVPVIGLVQVGLQARADRYTYLPLVGLFVALSWSAAEWLPAARRSLATTLAVVVLVALGAKTWIQVETWRDGVSLYTHAIRVTDRNFLAWNNLGMQRLSAGEVAEAARCFQTATELKPDYADAWYNAGVALGELERGPDAIAAYRRALGLDPENADGWVNLGIELQKAGNYAPAAASYQTALKLRPADAVALYWLALVSEATGDHARALDAYRRLTAIDPAKASELTKWLPGVR